MDFIIINQPKRSDGLPAGAPTLTDIPGFGSNPGNLRMNLFVPGADRRPRPLVVVLHGCTQTAKGYDLGSGWSGLAAAHDFLLLMPEQKSDNNPRACFSWYDPKDSRRDGGEVLSIRQMIARTVQDHAIDPARIFVCGLSAGGAMACAMLATYPELFAGGAIIAGLPYGTASNVSEALDSMQTGRIKEARAWGNAVRSASAHRGPWPAVAIWHGTMDTVVKPINAGELVKQWTDVHDLGAEAPAERQIGKTTRRTWSNAEGSACITEYSVPGLGHGAPVDGTTPAAPFFLPSGLSSTQIIAADWGLTDPTRTGASSVLGSIPK